MEDTPKSYSYTNLDSIEIDQKTWIFIYKHPLEISASQATDWW